MHERPGPQYNRGNDPTTGVCILKNATQKKWYLRFWNIFFFILRWRAESPVVFSGVSRGGGGRVRCPLSFRPKRGPKGREKFFFETGPPLYLRIWMTQPHPPPPPQSEGLDLPLVLLSRKEKWRLCLNRVKPRSLELAARTCEHTVPEAWKMYPFRAELRCIGHYREYSPGFRPKRRKIYTPSRGGRTQACKKLIERTSRFQ